MNRLQKKCVFVIVGVHLLLVVILIVGPAFFTPKPKPDNLPVLDVIPPNLVDAQLNSGVRNAQPPAPTPSVAPPPSALLPPARNVAPPAPKPTPERIQKPEPVKPEKETVKPDLTRVEKPVKIERHKIEINTRLVTRTAPRNSVNTPRNAVNNNDARRVAALHNAIQNLKRNFFPSTTVDMPGDSSVAYANYAQVILSIYEHAWIPPDNAENDEANTKVRVTIASDGTVISAHIIMPSGDKAMDASVQKTLERVTFIEPFPKGTTEKERTYIINFNLKAKRMLG